jgi:hypothetical protein
MADRTQLEMRWGPVTDEQGRTHLKAEWIEVSATPTASVHHAA